MNRLTSRDIEFLKSINNPVETSTNNNDFIESCISESRIKKLVWDGYVRKETLNNVKTFFRLTQRGMEIIKRD